jgi:hypothetical protein
MTTYYKRSRMLGLAFLIQFATSFISGVFVLPMATGVKVFSLPLGIDQIMANVVKNASLVRINILLELVTAAGVIFLGAMLYSAVKKQHEGLALTAFGLYVLEGVMLAIAELALFALLVFSREFVAAGSPASMEATARLLYEVMEYSFKIANLAFCIGGTIFYAQLLKASTVSRPLSLWGLIAAQGVFAGVLLGLFGVKAPVFLYVLYIPFEFVIAVWILIKGINKEKEIK